MQTDLLAGAPLRSLHQARAEGDRLGNLALDKAVRVARFDREGAEKFIHAWLLRHGPQSGEALTDAAKEHGYRPVEDRSFGPVYASLMRRGLVRRIGFCARSKGHGSQGGSIYEAIP